MPSGRLWAQPGHPAATAAVALPAWGFWHVPGHQQGSRCPAAGHPRQGKRALAMRRAGTEAHLLRWHLDLWTVTARREQPAKCAGCWACWSPGHCRCRPLSCQPRHGVPAPSPCPTPSQLPPRRRHGRHRRRGWASRVARKGHRVPNAPWQAQQQRVPGSSRGPARHRQQRSRAALSKRRPERPVPPTEPLAFSGTCPRPGPPCQAYPFQGRHRTARQCWPGLHHCTRLPS